MVNTQFNHNIKLVKSDNDPKFIVGHMSNFFFLNGISHQTSCVNTPQ